MTVHLVGLGLSDLVRVDTNRTIYLKMATLTKMKDRPTISPCHPFTLSPCHLLRSEQENWNTRLVHDRFGDAAKDGAAETSATMGCHGDDINLVVLDGM